MDWWMNGLTEWNEIGQLGDTKYTENQDKKNHMIYDYMIWYDVDDKEKKTVRLDFVLSLKTGMKNKI